MKIRSMMISNAHPMISMKGLCRYASPLLLVLVLLGLSACATTPQESDSLEDRAQLRWDSIFARDYATAYSLYSPGYRSTTSLTDFEIELRMQRVKWSSADYLKQECSENRCIVTFNVGYEVNKPVPGLDSYKGTSTIPGTWVKSGGQWWYIPPVKEK